MKNPLPKRIFFWTLVLMFFITSSLLILFAFGYRFNSSRGIFVYAGSINLATTPQEVNVYINGIPYPNKRLNRLNNSFHIGGITPGEYFIEVKAPGFKTWSKKIAVHSGVSTEFWNIILAKDSYGREDYDTPGIERFFISPRKNLAAFSQEIGNAFFVKIFDPSSLGIEEVFSSQNYKFTNDEKENIEWTPQGHRIIIPAIENERKNYFIVTVDTKEVIDLHQISQAENLSHVRWDPKSKNVLYYMSDDNLYRKDLDSSDESKLIAQHIASYDLSSDGLYYFQLPEGIVYRTSFDGSTNPSQITKTPPQDMSDPQYQIVVYDDTRIAFWNKSKHLYIFNKGENDTYFKELSNQAEGSQFSDDGKKLLYWTDRDFSVYFMRKWEVQPTRAENENMSITRFSEPIKNVQWTRDYEHVIFTVNKKIKMVELDNRDKRSMMDILSLTDDSTLLVPDFSDGKLYYTEKNSDGQPTLHSIYFPEKISIFGNTAQ